MPGMGRALQANNPTIVAAFHHALLQQLLWLLLIVVVLAVAWNGVRTTQYRRWVAAGRVDRGVPAARGGPEAPGRRMLRIGFGCLWLFDGLLQLQASMPLGLPSGVIQPAAGSVAHLGPAPRQRRRLVVVRPPGPGGRGHRVDPDRPRGLVAGGAPRPVVAGLGRGQRGLGPDGLVLRRGLRRDPRTRERPGSSEPPVRSSSTLRPACWSPCPTGPGRHPGWAGWSSASSARSSWRWRSCRPGRAAGSGRASARPTATPRPARSPTWSSRCRRSPNPGGCRSWVHAFATFDAAHGWGVNLFVVLALGAVGLSLLSGRRAGRCAGGSPERRCSAWPTGCSCRTSGSWAAWAPTPTA